MSRLIILGLVWAALSAATAYFADLWGRKLGKQRKSLFGWRPKQTAVFIITSSGAVIALLSFAVLLIANAGIRKALLQWDQTVEQLEASNSQMTALNAQMKEMQTATTEQRTLLAQAEAARTNSETALRQARANLVAQQRKVSEAQQNVRTIQSQLSSERAALNKARSALSSVSTNLEAVERSLVARTRDLAARKKQLQEAQSQVTNAERILKDLLKKSNQAFLQAEAARQLAEQALLGKLAVRRDQELVRRVVPPCRTRHEAREEIQRALNQASIFVQKETAARGVEFPSKTTDYVKLTPKKVIESANGGLREVPITEAQVLDAVAMKLMRPVSPSPGGVVLQVVAMANATAGEPVTVDFRLFENHIVFEQGEEITRFTVRQGQSREEVMNEIEKAMTEVSREARRKGLLPSSDDSVTALSVFQLAETYNRVMDALARNQSRVPVSVTAGSDTWTAGPLTLRILVDRSESEI